MNCYCVVLWWTATVLFLIRPVIWLKCFSSQRRTFVPKTNIERSHFPFYSVLKVYSLPHPSGMWMTIILNGGGLVWNNLKSWWTATVLFCGSEQCMHSSIGVKVEGGGVNLKLLTKEMWHLLLWTPKGLRDLEPLVIHQSGTWKFFCKFVDCTIMDSLSIL